MFSQKMTRWLLTAVFLLTLTQPLYAVPQAEILLEGEIDGANYRIRVPDGWDGQTLVVYAHGYRDKADQPGQTDNRAAEAAPGGTTGEDAFLAAGYAIAGSSYKDNGWAVGEGIDDTRALVQFFNQEVGAAQQTILLGGSMGGLVALASGERYPDLYDGVLALCPPAAGAPMAWDAALAFSLAYDVAFGWPQSWGTVADVRDDISFEGEVVGPVFVQTLNPANQGKFEFMRLVTGITDKEFMSGNNWLFVNMFYATEARAELERRAGGAVTQNRDHIYRLSAADKQYLATLNVDAEGLLAEMNGRSIYTANPAARTYVEANATLTGNLPLPVFTAHTSDDGLVPVNHEAVYRDQVAAAANLFQVYTDSVGHCSFTPEQVELVLAELVQWVVSGERPLTTPFSTDLGFLPDFTPPGWPIGFKQFTHLPIIRS
ncbi:MAG: alpha/beta hydrolase-fold protein [Chloroflexota bacterium]